MNFLVTVLWIIVGLVFGISILGVFASIMVSGEISRSEEEEARQKAIKPNSKLAN